MQSDQLNRVFREHTEMTDVFWSDEYWLKCNPLDNTTVMYYFYNSIFYDKNANNEKTMEDLSLLKSMRGLEFALVHSMPDIGIYHIKKQFRHSERKVTPIALYYVMSGKMYEAPSVHNVFSAKLRNLGFCLNKAFNQLAEFTDNN